jgi:hypothetical protein
MKYRLVTLSLAGALLAAVMTTAIGHQARATVTWSFFETGLSCFSGPCILPPQPFIFATLMLPGTISEGSAIWQGFGPPIYTGDGFIFSFDSFRFTPAFNGVQAGACGFGGNPGTICAFDISWSATVSELTISARFDAFNDNIDLHGASGWIATDTPDLGGCSFFTEGCVITGFWQNDLAVPEPSSVSLILVGLFGAWFGKRYQRPRPI